MASMSFNDYTSPFSLRSERSRSRLSIDRANAVSLMTRIRSDEHFIAGSPDGTGERQLLRRSTGAGTGYVLVPDCTRGVAGVHYVRAVADGQFLSVHIIDQEDELRTAPHARGWERFVLEPGSGNLPAYDAAVASLRANGFAVLRHMLSPSEVSLLKAHVAAEENLQGEACESGGHLPGGGRTNKRLGNLPSIPGGADLVAAAVDPLLHDVLSASLGEGFRCATWSSNTLNAGNTPDGPSGLGWHVDYPYHDIDSVGTMRSTGQPTLGVQVLWLLDEFRADNGGTMFCPGSHVVDGCPPGITPNGSEVPPSAMVFGSPPEPAGSVLIAHSSWWHRQTNNTTTASRTALLGNYTPCWVVPKDGMERQWADCHIALDPYLPNGWFRMAFQRLWLGPKGRGLSLFS